MSVFTYQQNLVAELIPALGQHEPFTEADINPQAQEFLEQLRLLSQIEKASENYFNLGVELLTRLVRAYPHLVHLAHRDLFWLFGRECMHFLTDDEITIYQKIEDERYQHEPELSFEQARAYVLKLN